MRQKLWSSRYHPAILKTIGVKKTLCLDAVSILMSVSIFAAEDADAVLSVKEGGQEVSLFFRPFMFEFLEEVRNKFELVIYSSLSKPYLDAIADRLEKTQKYFEHRFDESFCIFANISYGVKCIDFLLSNRSPENIIVVDTSARALPLTPENLVPIARYEGDPADCELARLAAVLDLLAKEPDVRAAIRRFRKAE